MKAVIGPRADDVDVAIEAAIDRVIGNSYFAKPREVCVLMGFSMSTYNRGIRANKIETTPRGDYEAVSRPVLRMLMKHGFGSMTGKSAA
jgi:hypothetical protein